MIDKPVFGDRFYIDLVKKNEAYDNFSDELKILFEKYAQLSAEQMGAVVGAAAYWYFDDCDVNDIYDFVAAIQREASE